MTGTTIQKRFRRSKRSSNSRRVRGQPGIFSGSANLRPRITRTPWNICKKGCALGDDDPEIGRVSKYHLALLLIRSGESDQAATLLASTFGQSEMAPQIKIALALAMLQVPLLPKEIDPSQDALIRATGEAASAHGAE